MLAGLVVIEWLSPESIGLWNSIYVILYYLSFLQLGMFNALNREMPFYLGQGKENLAKSLVATTQWHAIFLSTVIFIGTIVFSVFAIYFSLFDTVTLFSFCNLGLIISMQFAINFLTVTFRANKSFKVLSFINLAQSVLIILTLFIIYKYNYYGYVVRFLILSLSLLGMMLFYRPFKVKSKFSSSNYKLLLTTGIPLFTLAFLLGITDTFNRVVLLYVSDYKSVGYYYPAIAILVAMRVLPSSVSQFLYPKMSFEMGSTKDLKKIWGWVWKTLALIMLTMTPLAIIGYFLVPVVFEAYFPEYIQSIFAAKVALFSGVLSGSFIVITVFSSLKAWKELAILAVTKVLLYFSLQYFFASNMKPVDGVALGTLLADILFFIFLILLTYHVLIKKKTP